MKKFFRKIYSENANLLKNISYLGFTQFINFISPLLITPYLIRIIGIEKFGIVTLSQTIMNFTIILTEYGFNLSSTQKVSVNRNNNAYLNELYNEVFVTRCILIIVGFFFVICVGLIVPILSNYLFVFLFSYTLVIGRALIPTWFFTGIENVKLLACLNTCAKIMTYSLTLLVIDKAEDYKYVNVLWATGEILVGIFCVFLLKKKFQIKLNFRVPYRNVIKELRDGWVIFLMNSLNAIYMNSGIFILSLYASEQTLGMYAVAEKIMLLLKQLFGVISQVTYPHACRLASISRKEFNNFLTTEFYGCLFVFGCGGAVLLLLSDYIVALFVGYQNPAASEALRYLAFVPLIVSLNLPTYQVLIIDRLKRSYLPIILIGTVINIVLNILLVPLYLIQGTIATVFVTELFITFSFHLILYFRHPVNRMQYC